MPICVVAPKSGIVKAAYERSPRVALATDAAGADGLPAGVRAAADHILTDAPSALRDGTVPAGSDGLILWYEGDRLTRGSGADIRRDLFLPGRRFLVPVHLPCLPDLDVDLICVQPRWLSAGPAKDQLRVEARIAANPAPSKFVQETLRKNQEPWALLFLALLEEQQEPRASLDRLKQLWQQGNLKPLLASLVLRNLIVVLLREGEFAKAEELIRLGMKAYPEYPELPYLAAVSCIRQGKPSQAVPFLEQAQQPSGVGFVGSGGENSYRARWLLGTISALVGKQEMAFNYFVPSLHLQPVFRPAVEALLHLRLPSEQVYKMQWPLCELVRRQPEYLQPVFDYLLQHRQLSPAERLIQTQNLSADRHAAFAEQLRSATPFHSGLRPEPFRTGVVLHGPFLVHSSLARVNREIARALFLARDLDTGLEPHGFASLPIQELPDGALLEGGLRRQPSRLDLTIRLLWPPDFRRPIAGKLACILPWEYDAVPRKWVEEIERNVEELWVPSRFVRDAFVGGGVSPDRVHVLPLGVDPGIFKPEGPRWRPKGCRSFVFLFVGGLIARKGVDLLLEAYAEAFSAEDDVTLILKEIGSHSFYQHNTLRQQIQRWGHNRMAPHLFVISEELEDTDLAALYRGSDAFVLPYRGEGFGLPLVEALACGKPVVTTALGPARDFCIPESAYLIPARITEIPDRPPPLGEFTADFTWFEPDVGELARILRHLYENPDEAARRGAAAAQPICSSHGWPRIVELYLERVRQLTQDATSASCPDLQPVSSAMR